MKHKKTGKINWWKWLFLFLLALNLSLVGVLASRLLTTGADSQQTSQTETKSTIQVGSFSTTREQLTQTINSYLKSYQSKGTTFQVAIDSENIIFQGTYSLLGYEIPLYVYFEPYSLSTGAVQLKVTSVSAGNLALPESDILRYIKSSYDLPSFVQVLPDKSAINVNLQNLNQETDFSLKARQIDLLNDQFIFDIFKKNTVK
ncbi:YpmS family protein [Streptococcus ferus]|uniref:YpmS family protein n=1 Tax=Streptococcus ferus TaxID=1345 RepID=UPI0035A0CC62